MKPNKNQIIDAVDRLSCLAMFPSAPGARMEIMRLLDRMVPTTAALDWLIGTMVDQIGQWHGPKELRGLLCTRFKPADGIEADCSFPGFTPDDSEARGALEGSRQAEICGPMAFELSRLARQKRLE